jgi:PAS domain S-box-containing protein
VSASSRGTKVRLDEPELDDLHLRAVLETQPVTLVRLGRDGKVLAVNDAGLAIIGAERLEQILETSFSDLLQDDDRSGFLAFIDRVAAGHRSSLEVSLTTLTGNRHTIQLRATPHPGAPDGIDSVLVTLHDVTESRRLEQSLVEAMARQADEEAVHEAAREHLAEELRLALENQAKSDSRLAEIVDLKDREIAELKAQLDAAEKEHTSAVERHGATLQELTEALKHRQQINDEQALRLEQFSDLETRFAELTHRHDAAEAAVGRVTGELEKSHMELDQGRVLLETAHQEMARCQADIVALRDALNASMSEQAEAAARSQLATDLFTARLTALETALAAAQNARRAAIARAQDVTEGTRQLARQVISQLAGAHLESGTPAGELAARLETVIAPTVGGRLSVTVMVAAPDVETDAASEVVEQGLVALATNRTSVVGEGRIVIELAAVDIDEGASRSRGGMPCGAYMLVAMHVMAADAATGLAPNLFECADLSVWELAGQNLFIAYELMRLARGWIWLAREGKSDVVFELYLPQAVNRLSETEING